MSDKGILWRDFCARHSVYETSVPLFQTDDALLVETFLSGVDNRKLPTRSTEMDKLVISQVSKVLSDYGCGGHQYDGLIYMMCWKEDGRIVPLYIGKSEKYGQQGGNLSANIKGINNVQSSKFCRWGYSYAYHIGDLSAAVCEGHDPVHIRPKYVHWARTLFNASPSQAPQLRKQTYFWISAWESGSVGPWKEFGSTPLSLLEYLLIALASSINHGVLLNSEGVNRK